MTVPSLAAVEPQQLQLALAAADEVTSRHTRSYRAAELAAERARDDADRAERAFSLVEPVTIPSRRSATLAPSPRQVDRLAGGQAERRWP